MRHWKDDNMTEQAGPNIGENERLCPECGTAVKKAAVVCIHCGVPLTPVTPVAVGAAARSGTGLEPNLAAALTYLLTWVTGIIFLVVEKDNEYVRFHAKQAIAFGVAAVAVWIGLTIFFAVMAFLPIIGGIVAGLLSTLVWFTFGIGFLVIWIVLMVKAYQGQRYDLPVLGDLVKNWG
jgi:uncharacterized membrane protein